MSIDKYGPQLLVLPEDDANRQIAVGFLLDPNLNDRAIQVLPPAGGWRRVVDAFRDVHAVEMRTRLQRRILLVLDFDEDYERRFAFVRSQIPEELRDRVFILGALSTPEKLRRSMGLGFESIGKALAQDSEDCTRGDWDRDLLKHNKPELDRMALLVRPFLFRRG